MYVLFLMACSFFLKALSVECSEELLMSFKKNNTIALSVAQELLEKKEITLENSIYRAFNKFDAILEKKEVPSWFVIETFNSTYDAICAMQEIKDALMHKTVNKAKLKSTMLHAAADYINKRSKINFIRKTPTDAASHREILKELYSTNKSIISDQERDFFIVGMLVGIKINTVLNMYPSV